MARIITNLILAVCVIILIWQLLKIFGLLGKVSQPDPEPPAAARQSPPETTAASANQQDPEEEPEDRRVIAGRHLFLKFACYTCHMKNSPIQGGDLAGIFGEPREFTDGSTGMVDDAYLKESIFEPMKKVRKGYLPVMTPWRGVISDQEADLIILYLKSLEKGDDIAHP